MSEIKLPKKPVKAERVNPRNLIIYGKPKIGKTTIVTGLKNYLIIDLEGGTDFVDSVKIKADNYKQIIRIGKTIKSEEKKEGKPPYDFIVIDNLSRLEEMAAEYGEVLYANTVQGKKWFLYDESGNLHPESGKAKYGNIINMPNGAGYTWLRLAMEKLKQFIETLAPNIIYIAHVKDVSLNKNGVDINVEDVDLTGKLKRIILSDSDAVAYVSRNKNKLYLNFVSKDDTAGGTRIDRLDGASILISEKKEDGTIETYWNEIYV